MICNPMAQFRFIRNYNKYMQVKYINNLRRFKEAGLHTMQPLRNKNNEREYVGAGPVSAQITNNVIK